MRSVPFQEPDFRHDQTACFTGIDRTLRHRGGDAMTVSTQDFERLVDEHRVLIRQYAQVQARSHQYMRTQEAEIERLQAEVVQLRAALIARDTALAWAAEDQARIVAALPGLPKRFALARRVESLLDRMQSLLRERTAWQWRGAGKRLDTGQEKAVLCIGQDPMTASATRELVERVGGRFLHHDGGDEVDASMLEASLIAADLVICQTGCVSHGAYWRVQDHCKRTGKRCVLVDRPDALDVVRVYRSATTR